LAHLKEGHGFDSAPVMVTKEAKKRHLKEEKLKIGSVTAK